MFYKIPAYQEEKIHITLLNLIRVLDERQRAARDAATALSVPEYLEHCNKKILEILNIPNPE